MASLPAWSVNVYKTLVVPTGKVSLGLCDLETVGGIPELSVAVGSVQPTAADGVPNGIVAEMGKVGQPVMTGGIVSSSISENDNKM